MQTNTDRMLSAIDNICHRLRPLDSAIDLLVRRVAPHATASADVCPPPGYVLCDYSCVGDSNCGFEGGCGTHWYYASSSSACQCNDPNGCYYPTCTSCDGTRCSWFSC